METIRIEKAKEMVSHLGIKAEFFIHEQSGKTTEQAATANGLSPDNILKTLILFAPKENQFIGVIILGTDKIDSKKVAQLAGVKKLSFATPSQIETLTGFMIGGVPPIAVTKCTLAIMDSKVAGKEIVVGAGGDEHCGMKFSPEHFKKKLSLRVEDITIIR